MNPFHTQLAELCHTERPRAKWVIVPTHTLGHTPHPGIGPKQAVDFFKAHRALYYSEELGTIEKLRPYGVPNEETLRVLGEKLSAWNR